MQRKKGFRGVFILTVVMMMMAAGSAYFATIDFENPSLQEGDSVEGMGVVHPYLDITPWSLGNAIIVADSGTIKAYQGGSGTAPGDPTNNLCLEDPDISGADQGIGSTFKIPSNSDATWRFDFDPDVWVEDFSLDMLDYGDYFPYGLGNGTATLTAFDADGAVLDTDVFGPVDFVNNKWSYDACGDNGIQRLEVEAGPDEFIAYTTMTFDGVDPGIAFDNIEFNYLCALPQEYDLIAGQHEDVGTVVVWDDGASIFVKYEVDDPWMLEEIHLAVGWTEYDIPQTKKNNPIPGQFPVKEYFDPLVSMAGVSEIPFGDIIGEPDGDVVVAAHAKVWNTDSEVTETAVSSRPGIDVYGPSDSYLALGDLAWGVPAAAVETWKHPSWPLLADEEAVWISNTYWIGEDETSISEDTWRLFHDEFDAPGYPTGASVVTATADNAEVVYLNGSEIGSDGVIDGPFVDHYEWNTVLSYPVSPMAGMNDLDFIVRNYAGSNVRENNPTGLIYSVDVSYYEQEETAWGSDGMCEFDGRNWALCLEYTIGLCPAPPIGG